MPDSPGMLRHPTVRYARQRTARQHEHALLVHLELSRRSLQLLRAWKLRLWNLVP